MNPLLQLQGRLATRQREFGPRTFPRGRTVTADEMRRIAHLFQHAIEQWPKDAICKDILIEVHYRRIVPKSLRVQQLLKTPKTAHSSYYGIVGARFEPAPSPTQIITNDEPSLHHVITYYVPRESIEQSREKLIVAADYLETHLNGIIDSNTYDSIKGKGYTPPAPLSRSAFEQVAFDCLEVADIQIPDGQFVKRKYWGNDSEKRIVNLFKTEVDLRNLFGKHGFVGSGSLIDDTTLLIDRATFERVLGNAPYLVAMSISDTFSMDLFQTEPQSTRMPAKIASPQDEPVIGVIDTPCSLDVYFSHWVESENLLDSRIPLTPADYVHGTAVSSLIVDGPHLNPHLEDGCGRFRVRHFGIVRRSGGSVHTFLDRIETIVRGHQDIHVWNLSLGTEAPISMNFISPIAALLDQLQAEFPHCLFVVAGSNDQTFSRVKSLGSPADSLNSLVVNSVAQNGKAASYSRLGPVLSFFTKPDVAAFGGDHDAQMNVCTPTGIAHVMGTSFATPWVARKATYLMDVMGLPRDVVKALIIDSSLSWERSILQKGASLDRGYGIVPRHISQLLESQPDEIKFYIAGEMRLGESYSFNLPVPNAGNMFPYKARVVLSYAPHCDKNQGVDYPLTEIVASFGPLKHLRKRIGIKNITNCHVYEPNDYTRYEENARRYGRKWDNVKIRAEALGERSRGRKIALDDNRWGLQFTKTERLDSSHTIRFGAVLTLKATDKRNRYDSFIKQCASYGWRVTQIRQDIREQLRLKGSERVEWE